MGNSTGGKDTFPEEKERNRVVSVLIEKAHR